MLTLGTKYAVEDLRQEVICRLRRLFPSSITEWDAILEVASDPPVKQRMAKQHDRYR